MANEIQVITTSGQTVYVMLSVWGGANSGEVWDVSNSSLVGLLYENWQYCAIPLTSIGNGPYSGTSTYAANFPAVGNLPNYWLGVAHQQIGSTPSPNDLLTIDNSANQLVFQSTSSDNLSPLFGGASQLFAPSVFNLPEDLYNEFGQNNIVQWSDLDGTGEENTSRELFMTLRAAQTIRSFFSSGNNEVLSSAPDMPTVNKWSATMAGCFLFAARGAEQDPRMTTGIFGSSSIAKLSTLSFGRFEGRYDLVQSEMGEYRAGFRSAANTYKCPAYYGSSDPPIFPNGQIAMGPWGL